ncbi:MAG: sugar transferase [Clostridia bacterium]|nr:sugar transferase [Clostridia bacterium]
MNPRNTDSVLRHLDFAFFDTVTLQLSLILMYWITGHSGFIYQHERYWLMSMAFMFGQFAASMFADVYQKVFTRDLFAEFKALLLDIGVVLALGGTFLIIMRAAPSPKELLVMVLLFFDINFFVRSWNKARHLRKGLPKRKVVIVASGDKVRMVIRRIGENKTSFDHELCGVILLDQTDPRRFRDLNVPIDYVYGEQLQDKLARLWIDDAFVLVDENSSYPRDLMESFLIMGITIHTSFSMLDNFAYSEVGVQELGSFKVITNSVHFVSDRSMFLKRLIDIAGGLAGTIMTGLIFIFVAPLIYIKSPGPIFFTQKRVGRNGRIFKMYKFRSMYMDAEKRKAELMAKNKVQSDLMFKMDDDPRIIGSEKKGRDGKPKGIGNFIRNTSLDEFPQFYNVLKGDMSLVGTRPPTVDEWNNYDPHHRIRMSTKPGITGMWQVSGRSEITDFEEVVELDKQYIEHWSIWMDFKILAKTVQVVLKHEGAS